MEGEKKSRERQLGNHSSGSAFYRKGGGRKLKPEGAYFVVVGRWWWRGCVKHFFEQLVGTVRKL